MGNFKTPNALCTQHPVLASKMRTCSFNSIHIVPEAEIAFHESQCESRKALLEVVYSSSNDTRPIDCAVTTQAAVEPEIEDDSQENW